MIADRVNRSHNAIRDPVVIKKVRELKKSGRKVIELNSGDPGAMHGKYGFRMPFVMQQALINIIKNGKNDGYANQQGEIKLREAVANDAKNRKITDAEIDNVFVGNGVSELIDFFFGITVDKGKNVVLPRPDYPVYTAKVNWYGGEVRAYDLDAENEWQPNLDQIDNTVDENTAAIVIINPSNPTGGIVETNVIKDIIKIAGKNNTIIISDEIYRTLRFVGEHTPTASLTGSVPVVTMDGMSKCYYSTGWRIGHALFSNFSNNEIQDAMLKLCGFRLCANNAVQNAYADGIVNMNKNMEEFNNYFNMLKERTNYTCKRLNSIDGIQCTMPKGAFYAFPRVTKSSFSTDKEFVFTLLDEEGIRVVPGSGFGMNEEEMFFRVVTLPSLDVQKEVYDKLENFMKRHS